MALTQIVAGARALAADVNQYYNVLKGAAAESITLISNAAGSVIFQPSSDPAVSTQLLQVKNAAGTVKYAVRADGSLVFSDASIQTTAGLTNPMTTLGDVITGGAAGAAGRLAVGSANQVLTVSSGVPAWAAAAVNNITTPHIFDDFITGLSSTTAGPVGQMAWSIVRNNGSIVQLAAIANHPGIWKLASSAVGSSYCWLQGYPVSTVVGAVLPADTFDITIVVRPSATVDTSMLFRFGLWQDAAASAVYTPTDGIYVEKASADTQYFGVTRAASAQTRTAALGTVTNGTWAKFRIRRVDASTIGFTFNAAAEVNLTTNIPTAALVPFFQIDNNGVAVDRTIDIDLFDLTLTGLTR